MSEAGLSSNTWNADRGILSLLFRGVCRELVSSPEFPPENPILKEGPDMERVDDCRCIPVLRHTIGPWRLSLERKRPTGPELSAHYSRVAHSWSSQIRVLGFGAAYRALIQRLTAERALPFPSEEVRVLDAGIGAGDLSLALLREVESSVRLDGVDLCSEMLEVAAKTLRKAGARFRLKSGDITNLPYRSNRFDLVLAGHVLEHLSRPARTLRELGRVLKPGAPLVLIVTRATALGKMIQLRWGTRCFDEARLRETLNRADATRTQLFPLPSPPWCRWLSRACVAEF